MANMLAGGFLVIVGVILGASISSIATKKEV